MEVRGRFGSYGDRLVPQPECSLRDCSFTRDRERLRPSLATQLSLSLSKNRARKSVDKSRLLHQVAIANSCMASLQRAIRSAGAASRSTVCRACCTNRPAVLKIKNRSRLGRARSKSAGNALH